MPIVDPNAPVEETFDTEAATGQEGAAPVGTAAEVIQKDTTVFGGGPGTDPAPEIDGPPWDNGNNNHLWDTSTAGTNNEEVPQPLTDTSLSSTIVTTTVDQPLGVTPTDNPYVAPNAAGAPVEIADTTRTDNVRAYTGGGPRVRTLDLDGTTETAFIGGGFGSVPVTNTDVPDAPSYVYVYNGPRSVTVFWDSSEDPVGAPVRNYIIFDSTGGTFRADRNGGSYARGTVVEVEPNIPTLFRVAAVNDNGVGPKSDWSNYGIAWNADEQDDGKPGGLSYQNERAGVIDPYGNLKPGSGAPSRVQNLRVTSVADGEVNIAWDAPNTWGGDVSWLYVVLIGLDNDIVDGDDFSSSQTTYSWTGLDNDTEYEFFVFAVNDSGIDGPITSVFGTPRNSVADAPTDVRATVGGPTNAKVTWVNGADGGNTITNHKVFVYEGQSLVETITTGVTDGQEGYLVTGLTPGTLYVFRVCAVTALGDGNISGASDPITVVD